MMTLCGTHVSMSSALHHESDAQTKRVKHTLEQTLRMFLSPKQDGWDDLLCKGCGGQPQ